MLRPAPGHARRAREIPLYAALGATGASARMFGAYAGLVAGVARHGRVEVPGVERDELRELVEAMWALADGFEGGEGDGFGEDEQ